MSILNNQTKRDVEKHPTKKFPTEGIYHDCYYGIKRVMDLKQCKECPFNSECRLYSDLEARGLFLS